jgi:flagellar biosynthesis/type III secretory pathway protein FliH
MTVLKHLTPPDAPAADASAEPLRHRGVLRSAHARRASRPFEVQANWAPDFPVAPNADAEVEPEPEPGLDDLRAAWDAEAQQRIDAAVAAARDAAFAEGQAAGREAVLAETADAAEAAYATAANGLDRIHADWADHLHRIEPLLVQLALDATELLLGSALPDAVRDATTEGLTAAVEQLAADAPLTVATHPVDYLHLQEGGFVEHLAASHPGLRWTPNPALAEGDWIVESPKAAVRRIRSEMLRHLHDRLGLPADDGADEEDA